VTTRLPLVLGDDGEPQQLQSGDSVALIIPELTSDPASPINGQAWVLNTTLNAAGTLQAFIGSFPVVTPTVQSAFQLSFASSQGTKRITMS